MGKSGVCRQVNQQVYYEENEMTERNEKQISRRDMLKMLGGSAAGASLAKIAGLGGAATALLQGMPAGRADKSRNLDRLRPGADGGRHARRDR